MVDPGRISSEHEAKHSSALGEVSGSLSDLKDAATEHGKTLLEGAKQQATSLVDRQKDNAALTVFEFASSLRETGKGFEERPNIQAFVHTAADGLEKLATGLQDRSFVDLYGEAEDYARRSPLIVGAAALGAGFLLARFIKSSSAGLQEAAAASQATRADRPKNSTMKNG
jgi:hypothetical protein